MRWSVAMLAIIVAGCDVLSPESSLATVEVDTSAIAAYPSPHEGAIVPFAVRNVSDQPIYLERCGDRVFSLVDRRDARGWTQVYSDACPAVYMMLAARIEPGETFAGARAVRIEPGVFRLRVGVSDDRADDPEWTAASSGFELQ